MDTKTPLILIIEDESTLTEMYRFKLEREGFRVISASDGNDGIRMTLDHKPDVILLDIMMPGLDGISALKEIRSVLPGVSIIVFSNLSRPKDIDDALKSGANEYIIKSNTTPAEVTQKIKSYFPTI